MPRSRRRSPRAPPCWRSLAASPLPRTDVTKKVWEYIKKNKLQDAVQKRVINADAKLKEIFGKAKADMFEMTKRSTAT